MRCEFILPFLVLVKHTQKLIYVYASTINISIKLKKVKFLKDFFNFFIIFLHLTFFNSQNLHIKNTFCTLAFVRKKNTKYNRIMVKKYSIECVTSRKNGSRTIFLMDGIIPVSCKNYENSNAPLETLIDDFVNSRMLDGKFLLSSLSSSAAIIMYNACISCLNCKTQNVGTIDLDVKRSTL